MSTEKKFFLYRVESMLLLIIFIGAVAAVIFTGQIAWIILGWTTSAILQIHLYKVRCPKCSSKVMKRSAPKNFQHKWFLFFPKKCDSCGNILSS